MANEMLFLIEGTMPYRQRLQILDLLFVRAVQYGAENEQEFISRGLLDAGDRDLFRGIYAKAESNLEEIRMSAEFDIDGLPWLPEYFLRELKRPSRETDGNFVFYPVSVQPRFRRPIIDDILMREALALAGASLGLAAAGYEPFRIKAIHSVNPLHVSGILWGAAAVICTITFAAHQALQYPYEAHMQTTCEKIADDNQQELAKSHIDKGKALALGEAMKACFNSPIFAANPIRLEFPDAPK